MLYQEESLKDPSRNASKFFEVFTKTNLEPDEKPKVKKDFISVLSMVGSAEFHF